MNTKDFKHIYDCILTAVSEVYHDKNIIRRTANRDFVKILTGTPAEKQEVIDNYDLECCRVCEHCGELMTEGWLLDATTMCSDECAAWFFGETVEEFRHRMGNENMIRQAMEWDHCKKAYGELTDEERKHYLETALERTDFYWTEWE